MLQLNIFEFLAEIENLLEIKKPVRVSFRQNLKNNNAHWHGIINSKGKLIRHDITISRAIANDIRTLEELIIHEYIHAWQAENGHNDNHGRSFVFMSRSASWWKYVGKNHNIYLPDVDQE